MRSKICSLSKSEDFKSLLNGKKITNKYLTIFFKKLSDKDSKKLNISFVTKKKIGNAVKRNRSKRIMRELARKVITKFGKKNSFYVLIAKKAILESSFKTLEIEIKKLIS